MLNRLLHSLYSFLLSTTNREFRNPNTHLRWSKLTISRETKKMIRMSCRSYHPTTYYSGPTYSKRPCSLYTSCLYNRHVPSFKRGPKQPFIVLRLTAHDAVADGHMCDRASTDVYEDTDDHVLSFYLYVCLKAQNWKQIGRSRPDYPCWNLKKGYENIHLIRINNGKTSNGLCPHRTSLNSFFRLTGDSVSFFV